MELSNTRRKKEFWLIVLFVLSFLALVDGAYLTYQHYSSTPGILCQFGENFDCDIVSKSAYSTLDNIFYFLAVDLGISIPIVTISVPIAIMVIVVFLLVKIGILHIWHERDIWKFNTDHMLWAIRGILIFSLIYGMWLIYVQKYILMSYCLYCLVLDVLIALSLIVSFILKPNGWKKAEIKFRK